MRLGCGQEFLFILVVLLATGSCSRYGFEQNPKPCEGVECSGAGQCVITSAGEAACHCNPGYRAQGLTCIEVDWPCADVECNSHGTCGVSVAGAALCACDKGYRNDGPLSCVPDPLCLSDQDCDDGNVCTDDTCSEGSCEHDFNSAPCDDTLYCNGTDSCDGAGSCGHSGNPCPGLCDEDSDACVTCNHDNECSDGFSCTADFCQDGVCHNYPGDDICSDGLYCNGNEICRPDHIDAEPSSGCLLGSSPCEETECNHCNEPDGNCFDPTSSACGDPTDDDCTGPDSCDGAGTCLPNHAAVGFACDDDLFCNGTDSCDGTGLCGQHSGDPCGGLTCVEADDSCQALSDSPTFVQLASGNSHTCGLAANGEAWCWGSDSHGQLGNRSDGDYERPGPVDVSDIEESQSFIALCAGQVHTCGLAADGAAYCWGSDSDGQLGDGVPAADTQIPSLVDVSAIGGNDRALVQITCGGSHTCALTRGGRAFCWGRDQSGQLGNGVIAGDMLVPSQVDTQDLNGEDRFVHLAAGASHTCGINSNGYAHCWGQDAQGQLGNGDFVDSTEAPYPVSTGPILGEPVFTQIVAGLMHTCGLTSEGVVYCWGSDNQGSLGDGNGPQDSHDPVEIDSGTFASDLSVVSLGSGTHHSCAITADGRTYCWGFNASCQLGTGSCDPSSQSPLAPAPMDVLEDPSLVQVVGGADHTCGLTATGIAYCWGDDSASALGNGPGESDQLIPGSVDTSLVSSPNAFVHICSGSSHACGRDSRGRIFCWGSNTSGQLGTGGPDVDVWTATPIDTSPVTGEDAFVELVCGAYHNCGLTVQGIAWCWGQDLAGQLGDGNGALDSPVPVEVDVIPTASEKSFKSLAAGDHHTCGLTAYGRIFCWGYNQYGQLGNGSESPGVFSPVEVAPGPMAGQAVGQVVCGTDQTCARTTSGLVLCFGYDGAGALGNGPIGNTTVPGPIDTSTIFGLTRIVHMSKGGYENFCGITSEGVSYCWGMGQHGQIGDNLLTATESPSLVNMDGVQGEPSFKLISAAWWTVCAITAQGIPHCWGFDLFGQAGNGPGSSDDVPCPYPVDLGGLNGDLAFREVITGLTISCATTGAGISYCWGLNGNGQLGTGDNVNAHSPALVDLTALQD